MKCFGGQSYGIKFIFISSFTCKECKQGKNIFLPFPQCRKPYGYSIKSVIEVFAELSLLNGFFKVYVCGSNNTCICFCTLEKPTRIYSPVSKFVEVLLGFVPEVLQLHQENSSSVRYFKISFSRINCSGKCSFLMSK